MNDDRPLRVVFLGTPVFALPTLEGILRSGAQVKAVVCQPDRPKGRGLEASTPPTKIWAQQHGVPVLQPEKVKYGKLKALIEPFKPDVLVVTAYGRILPQDVLSMAPLGAVNAHASILPKYRGAAPIQWAIARGETETGVTLMQMDAGLDTGDILFIRKIAIKPEESSSQLHDRLAVLAGDVVSEALPKLEHGELELTPQDDADATLAPILRREDGFLDLRMSAVELANRTRGFQPWPGATLFVRGQALKVHRVQIRESTTEVPPGVIVSVEDAVGIQTGNGIFEVLDIQPEGKRRMAAHEFLAGHRLHVGDSFDLIPKAG